MTKPALVIVERPEEDEGEPDGSDPGGEEYWPECPYCAESSFVPQADGSMVCGACIRIHPTLFWIES